MTSIPGGGDREQREANAAGGRTTRAFSAFRSVWRRTAARGADRRVALDIGSSSVKLLEMRGSGEAAEVLRAGAAPVPEGALRSNAVADVVAVSAVIRQLAGRLGVSARRAVTAVPGPAVIVERILYRTPIRPLLREHQGSDPGVRQRTVGSDPISAADITGADTRTACRRSAGRPTGRS